MLSFTKFQEEFRSKHPRRNCDDSDLMNAWYQYFKENVQIGDGATVCYWTDRNAYTVVKKTRETLTLQRDKAILSKDFKPDFIIGGFSAHCTNQYEQSYTYQSDPDGAKIIARWSKKKQRYYWNGLLIISGRNEFYDYNF